MTDFDIKSSLQIQELSKKIENYLQIASDKNGKIDRLKLENLNQPLAEIQGLLLYSNTWCNDTVAFSNHIARLLAARDSSNALADALTNLEQECNLI